LRAFSRVIWSSRGPGACALLVRTSPRVLRYAAFATGPSGGNRAGIVFDATGLDETAMHGIAAGVGYSETAFLAAAAVEAPKPVAVVTRIGVVALLPIS
jgi:hypothetical protein